MEILVPILVIIVGHICSTFVIIEFQSCDRIQWSVNYFYNLRVQKVEQKYINYETRES